MSMANDDALQAALGGRRVEMWTTNGWQECHLVRDFAALGGIYRVQPGAPPRDPVDLRYSLSPQLERLLRGLATKDDLGDLRKILMAYLGRNNAHFDYSVAVSEKRKKPMPLKLRITDEQQVVVQLNPVTTKGKAVKLDGKPAWTVVDGDSTLVVADDGMSATLVSADAPGVTNFQVAADADLGGGTDTITDTIELTVVDPEASSLGLAEGNVSDKPEAPPTATVTNKSAPTAQARK